MKVILAIPYKLPHLSSHCCLPMILARNYSRMKCVNIPDMMLVSAL